MSAVFPSQAPEIRTLLRLEEEEHATTARSPKRGRRYAEECQKTTALEAQVKELEAKPDLLRTATSTRDTEHRPSVEPCASALGVESGSVGVIGT